MNDAIVARKPKHPMLRIVAGFLILFVAYMVFGGISGYLAMKANITTDIATLITSIIFAWLMIVIYSAFYKRTEYRELTELSGRRLNKTLLPGIGIGMAFIGSVMLTLFIAGDYKVIHVNGLQYIIGGLGIGVVSSVGEELLFRGILFRIIEERLGSIAALTTSALLFGFLHLLNPSSSIFMALCIAIEAGLLLGAAYMYSRNLWLPIGIHFAWNFSESGIFGVPNSGNLIGNSLLASQTTGNKLFTGGSFGPEGSLPCLVFGLTVSIILLYMAKKKGEFIPPFRKQPL